MLRLAIGMCLLFLASCRAGHRVAEGSEVEMPTVDPKSQTEQGRLKCTKLGTLRLTGLGDGLATVWLNAVSSICEITVEGDRSDDLARFRRSSRLSCWLEKEGGERMDPLQGVQALGGQSNDRSWASFSFAAGPDLGSVRTVIVAVEGNPTRFHIPQD